MKNTKIALLGMGAMGSRVARRWHDHGYELRLYSRSSAAGAEASGGGTFFSSPREAAKGADIVLSFLRDDVASRDVWLDPEAGALLGMDAGAVGIESSTLSVAAARSLHERARAREITFFEGPVVGSRPQAEAGSLVFLLGGPVAPTERIREALDPLCSSVHYLGGPGSAAGVKLVVNALFAGQVAILAELLGLVRKSGGQEAELLELLGSLAVTSPALRGLASQLVAQRYEPLFPIDLVEKDLAYVEAEARDAGAELRLVAEVRRMFQRAQKQELGAQNIHAVSKLFAVD